MNNRQIAVNFLKLASSGKAKVAFSKYIPAEFVHHNVYFKNDKESLMRGMQEAHNKNTNKSFDIVHIFEDKEYVTTHSHVKQENGNQIAVVHIFRIQNEKILELWDVGMMLPKNSPNVNGAF